MLENGDKLVGRLKISLSLFPNAKGIFGIEDNKPDCMKNCRELTKDEPRMEVLALKTKYPQGAERQLIYATTGRAINSAMLPADAGCVVDNVATISIYQWQKESLQWNVCNSQWSGNCRAEAISKYHLA